MNRIQNILDHPIYQRYLAEIEQAEAQREFCRHGFDHCLTVARIAYMLYLEAGGSPSEKAVSYTHLPTKNF